jgi:hypothetical protein
VIPHKLFFKLTSAPAGEDVLLSRREVADILGVSWFTVRAWSLDGKLPAAAYVRPGEPLFSFRQLREAAVSVIRAGLFDRFANSKRPGPIRGTPRAAQPAVSTPKATNA